MTHPTSQSTTTRPSYHHSLPTSLTPPELLGPTAATNIYTSSSEHVPIQTSTQATIIQTTTGTPIIINLNSNPPMVVIPKEMMNMTQIGIHIRLPEYFPKVGELGYLLVSCIFRLRETFM